MPSRSASFSYALSLPITWQRWHGGHTVRSTIADNPMLHANPMALLCRTRVMATGSFTLREYGFSTFSSHDLDLDLDPMTFIYKLDPYSLEIHRMCKYELPMSRLSKVIVWQTDTTEIIHHAILQVVNNQLLIHRSFCSSTKSSINLTA